MGAFVMQCDKSAWPGRAYADMLLEGSHEIDLALWLLGPAVCEWCSGGDEKWTLRLRHESGAVSSVILDGTHQQYYRRASIVGAEGVLSWQWHADTWKWDVAGVVGQTTPTDTYREELRAFLSCVETGYSRPACSYHDGMAVLNICAQARNFAAERSLLDSLRVGSGCSWPGGSSRK